MTEWFIRDCRAPEAEALLELWQEAEAIPSVTDTVEDIQRAIKESSAHVLVAEADSRLVGSIIGTFDGWRGHIYRLAVHPSYRRQGIARALVAEVERRLAQRGTARIIALVHKDHTGATGFWQAVGYRFDPRLVRYVRDF